MSETDLYFRQLLSGRDFATDDPLAQQMVNFVYAIGDRSTGECVIVDPAYAVDDLIDGRRQRRHDGDRRTRHPLPPGPCRRVDDGPHDRGHRRRCSSASSARSTCSTTRPNGSPSRPVSAPITSSSTSPATRSPSAVPTSRCCTPPATPRAASASSSMADSSPATRCSSRDAGEPICPARTRPTWPRACDGSRKCPTRRSCSPATATRWRAARDHGRRQGHELRLRLAALSLVRAARQPPVSSRTCPG